MDRSLNYESLAGEFERILDSDPDEEEVHQFFVRNPGLFGTPNFGGSEVISGALSKFPVSPDRIPDFSVFTLYLRYTQYESVVDLIELKRPSARLFVRRGRMSKDLNDAWAESQDSLRLLRGVYRDFLRRAVVQLQSSRVDVFDDWYGKKPMDSPPSPGGMRLQDIPELTCRIFIGRRSSLTDDDIARTKEITRITGGQIRVLTYDLFLDNLRDEAEFQRNRLP